MIEDIEHAEITVIGAGPAGIAAAAEAAAAGTKVYLIDKYPRPGGHYFKGFPSASHYSFCGPGRREFRVTARLFKALEQPGITLLTNSEVWAIFPSSSESSSSGYRICVAAPGESRFIHTQCVIVATGAYDRPVPFPGWTLPGVVTAGAAQMLVKSREVLPGKRILLAGTGPLQLSLASQLLRAGAELVAVLEVAPHFAGWRRLLASAFGRWEQMAEGWRYLRTLVSHRVPYRFGQTIFRAEGQSEVEAAVIGCVDLEGNPIKGSEELLAVDAICLGFGLLPANELARLLGCNLSYDSNLGWYVVEHNEWMCTSVPGVFVAGDCAAINGKRVAVLQGRIAALSAAEALGHLSTSQARDRARRLKAQMAREWQFGRALAEVFRFRQGLWKLATDDTELCRCEEVAVRDIRQAITDGIVTLNALRAATRVGMGRCQGRYCELAAAHLLEEMTLQNIEKIGVFTPRVPILPVRAGILCEVLE